MCSGVFLSYQIKSRGSKSTAKWSKLSTSLKWKNMTGIVKLR
jgi:hypothetical protein